MRVTQKYLLEQAKQLLIDHTGDPDFVPYEIVKTRLRANEYECGAAHFIIKVKSGDINSHDGTIYIFYPLHYLQQELNNGYELCIEDTKFADWELNIYKP